MTFNSQFVWILSFLGLSYLLALAVFFSILLYRIEFGKTVNVRNGKTGIRIVKGLNLVGLIVAGIWLFPLLLRLFKSSTGEPAGVPAIVFVVTVLAVLGALSWLFEVFERKDV